MKSSASKLEKGHGDSIYNRAALERADAAGCFHCLEVFSPAVITRWVDRSGDTALCPECGIDSVIPVDADGAETPLLLKAMNAYWFGRGITIHDLPRFWEQVRWWAQPLLRRLQWWWQGSRPSNDRA